jgi:hypothetical protein
MTFFPEEQNLTLVRLIPYGRITKQARFVKLTRCEADRLRKQASDCGKELTESLQTNFPSDERL